jgi:hypothetical protein
VSGTILSVVVSSAAPIGFATWPAISVGALTFLCLVESIWTCRTPADPQLGLAPENKFLVDFSEFARMIAVYDAANGYLANIAVTTSPGVPDLDQGTELW